MGLSAGYRGYAPDTAGPQAPSKYPSVGPNYHKFGEQKGWLYDPFHDKYTPDPRAQQDYLDSQGLGTPKPPGFGSQLGTIAATGGALAVGQGLAKDPGGFIGGITTLPSKVIEHLTPAASTALTPGVASTSGASAGGGLLGLGADSASGFGPVASGDAYGALLTGPGAASTAEAAAPVAETGALGTAGSAGLLGLAALGTYLGGRAGLNELQGKPNSGIQGLAGRGLLDVATGGINELVLPFLHHKTTQQYENERYGGLQDNGVDAAAVRAMNHPDGDTGVWNSGQFAGKKWNFDDALTLAKADPTQFAGVEGNYELDKNWGGIPADKRNAIVSQLINANLYSGDHGDVVISDLDKARAIRDQVMGGGAAAPGMMGLGSQPQTSPQMTPPPGVRDPGIDIQPQITSPQAGLLGLTQGPLKPGDKMSDGRTYMGPGVYR